MPLRRFLPGRLAPAAAAALLLTLAAPAPARAGCYEGLGCTDLHRFAQGALYNQSCEFLYFLRNSIYKENGYCFRTQRAIRTFGNAGCYIQDAARVPLNPVERYNVDLIKRVENARGCR